MQIDTQLLQDTLDYLARCPYKDVVVLLSRWVKCNQTLPKEEPKAEKKK